MSASAAGLAHADDTIVNANNQFSLSVGGHHLSYTEHTDQYDPLDSENGTQAAFEANFVRQGSVLGVSDIYFNASVDYATGTTAYNGYLESAYSPVMIPWQSTTHDKTIDVNVKLGRAFALTPQRDLQLIPYLAYGSHNWIRDMSDSSYGYYEHYRHQTISVGLLGQYAILPGLTASADFHVGKMLGAKMTASDVVGTFQMSNKPVLGGGLSLDYALTRHLHVSAKWQIEHFQYGASNVIDNEYEPDSTTTEQLFMVGVGYAF